MKKINTNTNIKTRSAASLLSAIAAISVGVNSVPNVSAAKAPKASDKPENVIKGSISLKKPSGRTITDSYFYSDDYFAHSSKEHDPHLSTMSAALAFAVRGTAPYPIKLLNNIGFSDIKTYDMDKTAADTLGTIIAHKVINGEDIIVVALRGDGYEKEFASNMLAGKQGDISGFASAAELVKSRIKAYIEENGLDFVKIWMTGYSRAGAVANLIGRDINRELDAYHTDEDNLYVYTVEAPHCSEVPTVYRNIHNIADCRDIVNELYPEAWGLYLNGVREEIGDAKDMLMAKKLNLIAPRFNDDFKEVNKADFIMKLADLLGENISRKVYSETLEEHLSKLLYGYFTLTFIQKAALVVYFLKTLTDIKADKELVKTAMTLFGESDRDKAAEDAAAFIKRNLDKAASEVKMPLSEQDYATLKDAVKPLISALVPVIKSDLTTRTIDTDGSPVVVPLYHIVSFIGNFRKVIKYHWSANVFEQLKAQDSYYA